MIEIVKEITLEEFKRKAVRQGRPIGTFATLSPQQRAVRNMTPGQVLELTHENYAECQRGKVGGGGSCTLHTSLRASLVAMQKETPVLNYLVRHLQNGNVGVALFEISRNGVDNES